MWIAHSLNRLASLSIAQPCLAACFQGIENMVLSCKKKQRQYGISEDNFLEDSRAPTRSSGPAPHLVQPSQTLNGVGVDHALQPRPQPHPCHGHVRLKVQKSQMSDKKQQRRKPLICTTFRISAVCKKKGAKKAAEFTAGAFRRYGGRLGHVISKRIAKIIYCKIYIFKLM